MKDLKEKICPAIRADCRYGYGDNVCDNCNKILDEYIAEHDEQIRAEAIDEFAKAFIEEGKKRKYLRHIWIENTCNLVAERLKGKK